MNYNRCVRRLLAISLLLLIGLPLVSSMLAATAVPEARLPACCRRGGAHHCSEGMGSDAAGGELRFVATQERCPVYPTAVTAVRRTDSALTATSLLFAAAAVSPAMREEAEIGAHTNDYRVHRGRAPPSL